MFPDPRRPLAKDVRRLVIALRRRVVPSPLAMPPLILAGVRLQVGATDLDLDIDNAQIGRHGKHVALVASPVAVIDEDDALARERLPGDLAGD